MRRTPRLPDVTRILAWLLTNAAALAVAAWVLVGISFDGPTSPLGEEVQESGDRTARTLGHDFDPPVGGVAGVADEPEFERSSPCPPPETHALHPPPHVDGHTDLLQTIAEGIKARLHDAMLGPSLPSAPP